MTVDEFTGPASLDDQKTYTDRNGIERSTATGKPRIRVRCPNATYLMDSGLRSIVNGCVDGRVPSEKRPGQTIQCPKCKGKGYVETFYTRCTSFVGVLDDRHSLEKWRLRIVLTGLEVEPWLMDEVRVTSPDDRDALDRLAERAFQAGEGYAKAQKGTDLHALTEYVDKGERVPAAVWNEDAKTWNQVTLQDRADLAAWKRVTDELGLVFQGMERFVVNDELQIGGTYDRLVDFGEPWPRWSVKAHPCKKCESPLILDLKTGRVDYGAGKMAQQLAVYAHSDNYDPSTGERTPQDVCQHVGIIVHLPQGTGEAEALTVDLEAGWDAVTRLSAEVRKYRRDSQRWMKPLLTEGSNE